MAASLADQMAATGAELAKQMPAEVGQALQGNLQTLQARFTPSPPAVGTAAPEFSLSNQVGKSVSLKDALESAQAAVVIVWYRGNWCPFCNLTLKAWREQHMALKAAGAQLLFLTPERPDESLDMRQKHDLPFDVLTDDDCAVASSYGVAYDVGADMVESHAALGVKFSEINGNKDRAPKLPVPATIVVGKDGNVLFAHAKVEYKDRADPADVVKMLQEKFSS